VWWGPSHTISCDSAYKALDEVLGPVTGPTAAGNGKRVAGYVS
jgi:hypothetical protein